MTLPSIQQQIEACKADALAQTGRGMGIYYVKYKLTDLPIDELKEFAKGLGQAPSFDGADRLALVWSNERCMVYMESVKVQQLIKAA